MTAPLTHPPLTAAQARELTDRIRGTAVQLHDLLLEAYSRGAWAALGYDSWRDYATAELSISQSYAYRLLDQARVIAAISEAAGVSPTGEIVTEREARDIKDALPWVTEAIGEKVAAGAEPAAAVREVVEEAREAKRDAQFSAAIHGDAQEEEDHGGPSMADLLEEQEREISRLEALVVSLEKGDLAAEVKRLSTMHAQLEGRLRQEITTGNEAKKQAQYQADVLKKIRTELGVRQTQEILPAIRALMAGRSVA